MYLKDLLRGLGGGWFGRGSNTSEERGIMEEKSEEFLPSLWRNERNVCLRLGPGMGRWAPVPLRPEVDGGVGTWGLCVW